jgi:hypothetical protein
MLARRAVYLFTVAAGLCLSQTSQLLAAVSSSAAHNIAFDGFDSLIVPGDIINGLSEEPFNVGDPGVYENPGDLGWHPANPAAANGSQDPHGLPTFTDGQGGFAALAGLLNENFIVGGNMPLSGAPVKVIEYVLAEPTDIGRINVLTGNRNNSDGRIFSTFVVNYSTDNGNIFNELGYFQSDPSGTINSETNPVPPLSPAQAVTIATVFDDANTTLLNGVTNLEFVFFAVDHDTAGQLADPFDGENTYTGTDDGLSAAFVSPLVWEIDVVAPAPLQPGDYNGDGAVGAADYVVWRNTLGQNVTAGEGADGDGNGVVNDVDYVVWTLYFGATAVPDGAHSASVPEPTSPILLLLSCLSMLCRRRRCVTRFP